MYLGGNEIFKKITQWYRYCHTLLFSNVVDITWELIRNALSVPTLDQRT